MDGFFSILAVSLMSAGTLMIWAAVVAIGFALCQELTQ